MDAYAICKAVNSPSVKVLFDVFQCQCESGDLINNIDRCWDEIGCIQIADNPGRCEPGTGEINFGNILTHIKQRGWSGLVEMEHGIAQPSRAGEMKVIDIYRELSEFVADATTERSYGEIGKV
jgi:hydroxypyruvate isomerase